MQSKHDVFIDVYDSDATHNRTGPRPNPNDNYSSDEDDAQVLEAYSSKKDYGEKDGGGKPSARKLDASLRAVDDSANKGVPLPSQPVPKRAALPPGSPGVDVFGTGKNIHTVCDVLVDDATASVSMMASTTYSVTSPKRQRML
jgi:hypothetical protein